MGRKWQKKRKNAEVDKSSSKVEKPKRERSDPQGYVVAVKENKNFETYYKLQELVPEEEWDDFMKSLQTSLPAAFRITGNTTQAEALRRILVDEYFTPLANITPVISVTKSAPSNGSTDNASVEEEPLKPLEPKALTWYPQGLAYQLNLSRRDIRRCEAYWRLHQCLITETEMGCISRQEAVSMIPPLLLDVKPHHKVLDMCAAPGSKTAQIIEQLHSSEDSVTGAIPSGIVVANDADNKRCYLLTHQAKRLQSPSIIITNHDAAFMPNVMHTREDGSVGKLRFDRILCDVPCSGDGTMRKNCDVWGKWNPVNASNLHGLQLRIARRGLELLAVGGKMVYSTCSLSPMENESVLQRLLIEANGAVNLVDCTDVLPGLKYREGLKTWKVVTKEMEVLNTPDDIPSRWTNVYHKHLFPVDKDLKLERCLRLLPHHQDTGGFFVAVLEKTALLPGEKAVESVGRPFAQDSSMQTQRSKPPPKKRRRQGFKEEPYYFLSDKIPELEKLEAENTANGSEVVAEEKPSIAATQESPSTDGDNSTVAADKDDSALEDLKIWKDISSFFGIRKIPEGRHSNFMTRSRETKSRNLYITNALVRDIIDRNTEKVKIINTGVKVLVRSDNKGVSCEFRLAQEGIQSILPLISKRVVQVSRDDLVVLLNDEDSDTPPEIARLSAKCQNNCNEIITGSVVLQYIGDPTVPEDSQHAVDAAKKIRIEIVGWKGKTSLRCYVARTDRVHYLRLIRADTSKYVKNKFRAAAEATAKEVNDENKLEENSEANAETAPDESKEEEMETN